MNLYISISRADNAFINHTYEVIYLVFPGRVPVRIEVSVLPVRAREDSKADLGNIVVLVRTSLSS
jgi:hypothetical protein